MKQKGCFYLVFIGIISIDSPGGINILENINNKINFNVMS